MAIHETKKQSDIEKRLKLLRQQIYGKENVSSITSTHSINTQGRTEWNRSTTTLSASKYQVSRNETKKIADAHTTNYQLPTTNISYLYQDLLKIGILASLAIGTQIILFMINLF